MLDQNGMVRGREKCCEVLNLRMSRERLGQFAAGWSSLPRAQVSPGMGIFTIPCPFLEGETLTCPGHHK